jgi:hypothetical protein
MFTLDQVGYFAIACFGVCFVIGIALEVAKEFLKR